VFIVQFICFNHLNTAASVISMAYIVVYVLCTSYQEGISGAWTSGWILAQKRTLFYCVQDGKLQEADLRKARCIGECALLLSAL
jgi:hypothetical protein